MGGIISVFLLILGFLAASPVWAQDSTPGQPDELQIIEFDYDHQNKPPAVNLPPTIQTPPEPPAPAVSQTPAPVLAPAAQPAIKAAPAAKSAATPAQTAKPGSQNGKKVITIIGEPEPPAATGEQPTTSSQSDEELLDNLFGSPEQTATGVAPAKKPVKPGAIPPPPTRSTAAPAGAEADKSKKTGPKTPAVSPLRPPVAEIPAAIKSTPREEKSSEPSTVKVERSSGPDTSSVRVEKSSGNKPKVLVTTARSPEGRLMRLFHDEAAIVDFNPRRRAVIDPHTRPKPPAAATYPLGPGLDWTDYRHWELGTYYWSLTRAGYYAKPLELATSRPIPINKAAMPIGSTQPKNRW